MKWTKEREGNDLHMIWWCESWEAKRGHWPDGSCPRLVWKCSFSVSVSVTCLDQRRIMVPNRSTGKAFPEIWLIQPQPHQRTVQFFFFSACVGFSSLFSFWFFFISLISWSLGSFGEGKPRGNGNKWMVINPSLSYLHRVTSKDNFIFVFQSIIYLFHFNFF